MSAPPINPVAQSIMASLSGYPKILMKMRIMSLGKNYDVMDPSQRVLCQIGLDSGQNVKGALVGAAVASVAGDFLGRYAQRTLNYTYVVRDAGGQPALEIRKTGGGYTSQFTVVDPASNLALGTIHMKRSFIGGLKADWQGPDGQIYLRTKGNIIRRKYEMLGPDNRSVGRVRHKILAIRDVWELDLEPGANHFYSALFATVLDFEKKM